MSSIKTASQRVAWKDLPNSHGRYGEYAVVDNFLLEILSDDDPLNPRSEWDNVCTMLCWHSRYNLGDSYGSSNRQSRFESWPDHYKNPDYLTGQMTKQAIEEMGERYPDGFGPGIVRPLYLYNHSGLSISMSPFSCPWDSGQVGWIYCSFEKALAELWPRWIDAQGKPFYPGSNTPLGDTPCVEGSSLPEKPVEAINPEKASPKALAATRKRPRPNPPPSRPERSKRLQSLIIRCMEGEVETYNSYLQGDVWGYKVSRLIDPSTIDDGTEDILNADADYSMLRDRIDEEDEDSCWGFFGLEHAKEEALSVVNSIINRRKQESEQCSR